MGPAPDLPRPLSGRRILITRPAARAAALLSRLREAGARAEARSPISFEEPADPSAADAAVARLGDYDWLLFTSANGVAFFRRRRDLHGAGEPLRRTRVAAIGKATARAARSAGMRVRVEARRSDSEGLATAVLEHARPGERALVVRPEVAREALVDLLGEGGLEVDAVPFYRTVPSAEAPAIAADLIAGRWETLVLTSPSTLGSLLGAAEPSAVRAALGAVRRVAIGAVTAASLDAADLAAHVVAGRPDDDSLIEALLAVRT